MEENRTNHPDCEKLSSILHEHNYHKVESSSLISSIITSILAKFSHAPTSINTNFDQPIKVKEVDGYPKVFISLVKRSDNEEPSTASHPESNVRVDVSSMEHDEGLEETQLAPSMPIPSPSCGNHQTSIESLPLVSSEIKVESPEE